MPEPEDLISGGRGGWYDVGGQRVKGKRRALALAREMLVSPPEEQPETQAAEPSEGQDETWSCPHCATSYARSGIYFTIQRRNHLRRQHGVTE